MIVATLLVALSSPSTPLLAVAPPDSVAAPTRQPQEDEVDARIKETGDDVDALLVMAADYKKAKDRAAAKKVFLRVLELDTDNKVARKGLRHQFYDGKWFTSYVELSKYKREEAAAMKAKGLEKYKGEWVPAPDIPFLSMAWVKGSDGAWSNPAKVERAKQVAAWETAGYQYRADDNTWIAPDDFKNWTEGLYLCEEEWVDLEKANEHHANINAAWQIASEHYVVMTTRDWQTGNWARWHAETTYPGLVRLFGIEPDGRQVVAVLRHLREYNEIASTSAILRESEGFSSIHGAYFADAVIDPTTTPPQYRGCGVAYWDTENEAIEAWGPYWIRWAAAQSYIDAIDRSWGAIGSFLANPGEGDLGSFAASFWREKSIPRWLRYGGASYVERFMLDPRVEEGGDPWGMRTFALGEVKKAGGLRDLKEIFAFQLSLDDLENSGRLYQEAGVVVAYLLDGAEGDAELSGLHQAFKDALAAGDAEKSREAAKALETELAKHQDKIKAFAGF